MDVPATNDWRAAYDTFRETGTAAHGTKARDAAFARFEAHGMPTRRHEYWKYTPVRDLVPDAATPAGAAADAFAEVDAFRLVFIDGVLDEGRSDRDALAAEADFPEAGAGWIDGIYDELQSRPIPGAQKQVERPFADLNMAMAAGGAALRIPAGTALSKPVHLRYEGEAGAHLRHVVLIEKGAAATLLESGAGALTTGAEIVVEDGATLDHLRAQTEVAERQFTALFARIGAEARFKSFTLAADAALIRNETVMVLAGEDGNGHVAAGVMGRGKALVDNTVYVSHEAPHCESRQVIKNVLDDDATAVFQGKIYVREGAQKTDGYQISQSVLLSEGAAFNAKPELEIYADDVMCSHGSTTGALDETALFYLRSRGVPQREAEAMLVAAFVDEAVLEIAEEGLQDIVRGAIDGWMAARAADARA